LDKFIGERRHKLTPDQTLTWWRVFTSVYNRCEFAEETDEEEVSRDYTECGGVYGEWEGGGEYNDEEGEGKKYDREVTEGEEEEEEEYYCVRDSEEGYGEEEAEGGENFWERDGENYDWEYHNEDYGEGYDESGELYEGYEVMQPQPENELYWLGNELGQGDGNGGTEVAKSLTLLSLGEDDGYLGDVE